jgi:hypothetical protein
MFLIESEKLFPVVEAVVLSVLAGLPGPALLFLQPGIREKQRMPVQRIAMIFFIPDVFDCYIHQ